MNLPVFAALVLSLSAVMATVMQTTTMKLGQVLVLHVLDLKADADTKALERVVLGDVAPAWKKGAPGVELHLLRADRGGRKGQYALLWTIDTRSRWAGYAPPSGNALFSPELVAKVGDFQAALGAFVSGAGQHHEYQLLSPEKVGILPEVGVLGIHYTRVYADRREAFERFVSDAVHPAVANLRPDLRLLYYKAVRGPDAGNYIALFALTTASRDKYWPGGSDSDELRAAFKPVQALTRELSTYLVEGSYLADPKFAAAVYESREWADFVRVGSSSR
jgi:hypothetical protein